MGKQFAEEMMDYIASIHPASVVFISAADCTYVDTKIYKNTYTVRKIAHL